MKVILTGSTGFIGGEVLDQTLANPRISTIFCLTRRALPDSITSNPKVQVIIVSDFTAYTPEILAQLRGSEVCIWAMGSPAHKNPDLAASRKIEIEYTLAGAKAFTQYLAPALKAEGKTFRFVYLSGMGANRDTNRKLWFLSNVRNIKGEVENGLLDIQGKENSNLEVSIVRPGGVLAKGSSVPSRLVAATMSIKVDALAAAMVNEAVEEIEGTRTLNCDILRKKGRQLLKGGK